MPNRDDVIYGAPCWSDLMTANVQGAAAFYTGLFGWTAQDMGEQYGHYTVLFNDDRMVGAVTPKAPGMEGVPDAWNVYFAVHDANATTEAVKQAGGGVLFEPLDVMGMGTMAILSDPTGAVFGLWQPGTHRGYGVVAEAGAPCWFELLTRDIKAAQGFYPKVFDVTMKEEDTGEGGPEYRTLNVNGEPEAGVFGASGIMPDEVPPYWTVYYGHPDIDAAIRYVEENGGSVITPIADSPYGKWATVTDPSGAAFVVLGVPAES